MFKTSIAALAAAPLLASGAAFAGPYVNLEATGSYPDGAYSSGGLEAVVGYEGATESGIGWYLAGGPVITSPDGGDSTTDFIGYVGGSYPLTESVGAYGEFSVQTADAADNAYSVKVGAKYTF